MKLRQWEIEQHFTALLGSEPEVFWAGSSRSRALLLWPYRDGLAFLQRGNMIAVSIHGGVSAYFEPCLDKISDYGVNAAVNMIVRIAGLPGPLRWASVCEDIADMFKANNEAG